MSSVPRPTGPIGPFVLAVALVLGLVLPATAGEIPLAWDPVSDPDLAGYHVYYGESSNSYGPPVDVGNTTSYTLGGLTDCTTYYVAVKAYDTGGLESDQYSNELVGLPTPVVSSLSPSSGEQGQSLSVTVSGTNFDTGATVQFSGSGITIDSTNVVSCTEIQLSITIASGAAVGLRDVEVTNPDQSFGTLSGGFEVVALTEPTVSSTAPADGATGVSRSVLPTVTFSEPMDAASITPSTVRLLDATGAAVPQASGYPTLSGDGLVATIDPASDLDGDATYRIEVAGGPGGVRDAMGTNMASTYTQNPGFTTESGPDVTPPTVDSTDPADGQNQVRVDESPTVLFSEAMDPATITPSTVRLLDPSGSPVTQAPGYPTLSADGLTATINPLDDLDGLTWYKIEVVGGPGGVADVAGNPMASTYVQPTGFRTKNTPPGKVNNLRRRDKK